MKTAFALAFLAIICGAQATSLSEIDKSVFGKNLLDTIFLEMKTGDNAQAIIDLLHQVADEITQEQADHDTRHNEFQTSAAEDIAHYEAEIARADEDIAVNTANLDRDRPALDAANAHLADLQDAKSRAEDTLAYLTEVIEQQREDFHTHQSELLAALDVFGQARDILRQSFGQSFLQTSAGSALAAHLSKAKVNGKFEPFVRILAQAAASGKLTDGGVDQILSLLDRLTRNTEDTLASERQIQAEREAAYAHVSAELTDTITELANEISEVNSEIDTLTANIAEWEARLEDANARHETYTNRWNDRTAERDAENAEYADATARRAADLDIVHEVTELISSRVADFTQYITSSREDVHID
jgi:chromosome segregation ATPase